MLRRSLGVLVALTLLVLAVDLARPSWTAPLRAAAGTVIAPVQRALAGSGDRADLQAELDGTRVELALARSDLADRAGGQALADTGEDRQVVMARVVGVSAGTAPVALSTLTLDRGSAEGVLTEHSVVSAQGLVGRVLRVREHTSDVLLLGDPDLVVGARYGDEGALASIDARPTPGLPPREPGELTLTAVGDTPVTVGDEVRTLGSPGSRPFVADLLIGTVTAVDPDAGALGATAVVRPAADLDTLDHLAVIVPGEEQ